MSPEADRRPSRYSRARVMIGIRRRAPAGSTAGPRSYCSRSSYKHAQVQQRADVGRERGGGPLDTSRRAVSSLPRRSFSSARPNSAPAMVAVGFDGPLVQGDDFGRDCRPARRPWRRADTRYSAVCSTAPDSLSSTSSAFCGSPLRSASASAVAERTVVGVVAGAFGRCRKP